MRITKITTCFSLLLLAMSSTYASPPPQPAAKHPYVGTWAFAFPGKGCVETYKVHPNGTTSIVSDDELAESAYEISAKPSKKGFYKLVNTVTSNNGKADCSGNFLSAGTKSTYYLQFSPSADMFLMCEDESLHACFGPLMRVQEKN
ncbi:hypothetical protein [Glaciimonas soli]|uniref:Uncharacterized protein n=1 Tax=Glaciimonas soli TaxID=2590999 RepID=A0A843YM50_9BURK|nr:hypothetical protein [Glaciimonas soli]MQQ99979.1 hypothetical protein [Glaciimonas soli]